LNLNVKNSKRSWELLKEAANLITARSEIEKIEKNGHVITDKLEMANEFNDFLPVLV
jgi:hypothetical protein